jgi:hypothetical protein
MEEEKEEKDDTPREGRHATFLTRWPLAEEKEDTQQF